MREKFVQNNEEALNEFPLLKQQFLDANESINIVEQALKNYKVAQRDVQKYRLETLASESVVKHYLAKAIVNRYL